MDIICYRCEKLLVEPGALMFGPPPVGGVIRAQALVWKYHLCRSCFREYVLPAMRPDGKMED